LKHSLTIPTVLSAAFLLVGCHGHRTSPVEGTAVDNVETSGVATASSNGNPSATGGGTTLEGGESSRFTFNAIGKKDGSATGHLEYQVRVQDAAFHMSIDCLRVVGNQASLSGTVTHVTGAVPSYVFVGQKGVFKVEDNGEGAGAAPDQISDVFLYSNATCTNTGFIVLYLPIDGNIQVRN
jgi:hypothetical protein